MQKALKAFLAIVGRVLFIGFSIQIILGICWMVCNFAGVQKFGESVLYEEISKTLICDEYEGILYPVLILIARGIEELILIPYHYILYLLQIGFAYFAAYKFLQNVDVKGKFWKNWGSLVMLTFPMAMQCHLAVLADSLVCSLFLLELSFAAKILLEGQQLRSRQLVKVLGFWLPTALLQPEYLYVGAVPVLVLFLYGLVKAWKSDKKKILYNGLMAMAFAGIIVSVEDLAQVDGYYGRVHQSVEVSLVSRFAWLTVRDDYAHWPNEVKDHISWEEMLQIDHYADHADRILGRMLERAVGEERARELFVELANVAWQRHRRSIVYNMAWDAVGYTFSPILVPYQFEGGAYDSYSGRNYDIMRERTPLLTKYYMDYGCRWFAVGLGVAVIMQLIGLINCLYQKRKKKVLVIILYLSASAALILLYTLRGAGMMDYKKTIAVGLLWTLWMVVSSVRGFPAQRENENEASCEG